MPAARITDINDVQHGDILFVTPATGRRYALRVNHISYSKNGAGAVVLSGRQLRLTDLVNHPTARKILTKGSFGRDEVTR